MCRRVTVLVLCVCLCLSHLTSGSSVCPEDTVMYSAGNGGQKIVWFSLKPLHCRYPVPIKAMHRVSHFPAESAMHFKLTVYIMYHVVAPSLDSLTQQPTSYCTYSIIKHLLKQGKARIPEGYSYVTRTSANLLTKRCTTSWIFGFVSITHYTLNGQRGSFVWISLKLLHCKDTPLLALYGYPCSRPFWNAIASVNTH